MKKTEFEGCFVLDCFIFVLFWFVAWVWFWFSGKHLLGWNLNVGIIIQLRYFGGRVSGAKFGLELQIVVGLYVLLTSFWSSC